MSIKYKKPCRAGAAYITFGFYAIDEDGVIYKQKICFKCGRPIKEKDYRWIHILNPKELKKLKKA